MDTLSLEWKDSNLTFTSLDNGKVMAELRVIGFQPLVLVLTKDDAIVLMEWLSRATL